MALIQPGALHQRIEPQVPASSQHGQPFPDEDPVLIGQVHHITYRGNGYIFNQVIQLFGISPGGLIECLHQLIGHRRAA